MSCYLKLLSAIMISWTISCQQEEGTVYCSTEETIHIGGCPQPSSPKDRLGDGISRNSASLCQPHQACISGYISHAGEIYFSPFSPLRGRDAAVRFHDAQDFGDRFHSAFVQPVIDGKIAGIMADVDPAYPPTYAPVITRQNFATMFAVTVTSPGMQKTFRIRSEEGNFELPVPPTSGTYDVRVYGNWVIRWQDRLSRNFHSQCLTIESKIPGINAMRAGEVTLLGGVKNFDFYYHEASSQCSPLGTLADFRGEELQSLPISPSGDGDELNPYVITEIGHLLWISDHANDDQLYGATAILDNDLDFSGYFMAPLRFPRGMRLNGRGFAITNLEIRSLGTRSSPVGLFGVLEGTVENLQLLNLRVRQASEGPAGILAGDVQGVYLAAWNPAKVRKVTVIGQMSAQGGNTGKLIGFGYADSSRPVTILDSIVNVDVVTKSRTGGDIAGECNRCTIISSYATGLTKNKAKPDGYNWDF